MIMRPLLALAAAAVVSACTVPSRAPTPDGPARPRGAGGGARLGAMPPDCSQAAAPAHPVAAAVADQPVVISRVALREAGSMGDGETISYDTFRLEFENDDGFELGLTLAVPRGGRLDGRTYRRFAEDRDDQPQFEDGTSEVQGWRLEDPRHDVDVSFVFHSATVRIDFGTRRGAVLPGRIWFCAPEIQGAQVAGAFEAQLPE